MKIIYFISLLIATLFFNACATPTAYSPEQIDSFAIPPSNDNNLFSLPKNGYARLIMYRDDSNAFYFNDFYINYESGISYERALCRLDSNSSCIVNIRAGNALLLFNRYEPTTGTIVFAALFNRLLNTSTSTRGTIFTPKNQHIYCVAIEQIFRSRANFIFKDKNTCLKEYKEMYKPEHRKEQEEWLNDLIKDGDKRAYQE